jgi:hypothetical protein
MDNELSFERLQAALLLAIQHAVMLASPEDSDLTIATRLYFAESSLLRQLARHVMVEYIRAKIRHVRQRPTPAEQLPIPGLKLPLRISVRAEKEKKPRKVALANATLSQLVAYKKSLLQQSAAVTKALSSRIARKISQLDQLIAFMRKHAKRRRGVTLAEVMVEQGRLDFMEEAS